MQEINVCPVHTVDLDDPEEVLEECPDCFSNICNPNNIFEGYSLTAEQRTALRQLSGRLVALCPDHVADMLSPSFKYQVCENCLANIDSDTEVYEAAPLTAEQRNILRTLVRRQ